MKMIEPQAIYSPAQILEGKNVTHTCKHYAEAMGFYHSASACLPAATKMYEVYSYTTQDDAYPGHLSWGLTVLYPLMVDGECNMTRGHFHSDTRSGEFYYGLQGQGLLMLMDDAGTTWAEKVFPGSVHSILGTLAHRLINTGDEALSVAACWPNGAGHDYQRVEKQPFGYRVYKNEQGICIEKAK